MSTPPELAAADAASARGRRGPTGGRAEPPPAVFPGRIPLEGPRVRLEPLDPRRHARALFESAGQGADADATWEFMGYGPFADVAEMTAWLRTAAATADTVFLALRDRGSGDLFGMASFLEIRPLVGVVELGHIWFATPWRRSVQTTEALALMMRHVMSDLGYRRLEWKCNALNFPSRWAALRLGFRHEGVFLNHLIVKGRNRDTAWYSITEAEWPAVAASLDRWLAPENFDDHGRQRNTLSEMSRRLW